MSGLWKTDEDRAEEERTMSEIQKGRILAKAIIRRANGQHEAIVVYEGSCPTDFFWTYRLRSRRAARKTWTKTGALIRVAEVDFETRVKNYALTSTVVFIKVYHARRLKTLLDMPDEAFYGPRREVQPWEVEKLNRKFRSHMRGGLPAFGGMR